MIVTYQLVGACSYLLPAKATNRLYPVADGISLEHPFIRAPEVRDADVLTSVSGDRVWFSTRFLTLHVPFDDEVRIVTDYAIFDDVIRRLRRLSRQASLPRMIASFQFGGPSSSDEMPSVSPTPRDGQTIVNEVLFKTSITETHLRRLVETSTTNSVHEDLLLDSIEALESRSYRSAIIYAACAAEAAASRVLEGASARALAERPERMRVITRPQAGGQELVEDPIDKLLRDRDEFRTLLHERPLYLLGRSLLVENEALYALMLRLYRTRNSIVHSSPSRGESFPVDEPSSKACIEGVVKLLTWLGLADDFVLPGRMIDLETGEVPNWEARA